MTHGKIVSLKYYKQFCNQGTSSKSTIENLRRTYTYIFFQEVVSKKKSKEKTPQGS